MKRLFADGQNMVVSETLTAILPQGALGVCEQDATWCGNPLTPSSTGELIRKRVMSGRFATPFAVDVRFLTLDRRTEIPLHRPDHLEVVVFESGEQLYEVENNICTLHKDDVIIVGNRISHRCLPAGSAQRPARTIVLSFLPQTVHSGIPFGDDLQYLMPFNLQGPSVPNVIHANPALSRENP